MPVVDVLGRPVDVWRNGHLHHPEPVLGMATVFEEANPHRASRNDLAAGSAHDRNAHAPSSSVSAPASTAASFQTFLSLADSVPLLRSRIRRWTRSARVAGAGVGEDGDSVGADRGTPRYPAPASSVTNRSPSYPTTGMPRSTDASAT